jgi:hypothetical protein
MWYVCNKSPNTRSYRREKIKRNIVSEALKSFFICTSFCKHAKIYKQGMGAVEPSGLGFVHVEKNKHVEDIM